MSSPQAPRDVPRPADRPLDPDVLAARYGRRPPRSGPPWYRRPARLAAAVVGAALVLAYGVWLAVAQSQGPSYTEISHEVLDDRTAQIRFSVTRDPGTAVRCQVHALDDSSSEVGLLQVDVPASPERDVEETVQVRTTSRAVTVGVESCSAVSS
ncbi:DUF4307 domain-containing protein [Kineococcus rhizosphaerae]|uniref:Uncharacterized protein DUF4307 n=1 Tax=Kineococcus rhizosphaerae TaxID=559628 RepID=A0A2T0R4D0_9ACTN|nr:DUF4307 domain-containing protein [Kineococcus rhizosphaerae]PRY15213.1 uncharacterized protein DUF4307 [Kineococcus rhizosphaerae]